jgi:hypothetical protein
MSTEQQQVLKNQEPMWPSLIALAAAGALYAAMPGPLAVGPPWLTIAIVFGLMVPGELFHSLGKHKWCKVISYTVLALITCAMIWSVLMHVVAISQKTLPATRLLLSAIILRGHKYFSFRLLVLALGRWRTAPTQCL